MKAKYYRVLSVKIEDPTKRHHKEKHLLGVLFHCFQKRLVNLQWSFVYMVEFFLGNMKQIDDGSPTWSSDSWNSSATVLKIFSNPLVFCHWNKIAKFQGLHHPCLDTDMWIPIEWWWTVEELRKIRALWKTVKAKSITFHYFEDWNENRELGKDLTNQIKYKTCVKEQIGVVCGDNLKLPCENIAWSHR